MLWIYGVWDVIDQLIVKGGILIGFCVLDVWLIVFDYVYIMGGGSCCSCNSCGVILGNDDLDLEEIMNFEFGVIYEVDSYSVSVMVFYIKFKNKL